MRHDISLGIVQSPRNIIAPLSASIVQWYYAAMTRDEAVALLSMEWVRAGDFLVRDSSQANCFALSFRQQDANGRISHRLIRSVSDGLWSLISNDSDAHKTFPTGTSESIVFLALCAWLWWHSLHRCNPCVHVIDM